MCQSGREYTSRKQKKTDSKSISIKIKTKITYIRGLYVRVTWNVFTSISVQSCSPITLSPPVRDGTRASLIAHSSIISWLSSNLFSIADCCWSVAVVIRTILTVFIISREFDLHDSTVAVAVARPPSFAPFSLLRRDEVRCKRCLSLDEFFRRLGNRFTDSALALKPAAIQKRNFYIAIWKINEINDTTIKHNRW